MTTLKKILGTTLLIGSTTLETTYGDFDTHTFQDVIDKKYVIALCYGDMTATDKLHIRVHSSCLTSETMRSLDCDCVHQLNGALQKIKETGHGILFYLLQSGRGASYISKSRGCQLVQYMKDKITTFDAYEQMGLKADYRDYRNVKDIIKMMDIQDKEYYLMTNNPDKITKLTDLGINLKEIVSIEFPPNPFNQQYLKSKQQTGHLLYYDKEKVNNYSDSQPSVKPFRPYHLQNAERFIHCASYFLPIEPVANQIIISNPSDEIKAKALSSFLLPTGELLMQFRKDDIEGDLLQPYWFQAHVYYDIASHTEYVVLTYGDLEKNIPIVRIHSEFIFNRFPITNTVYKERYTKALMTSIKNNAGIIIIENHNGDNQNIGNFLLEEKSFDVTGIRQKRYYLPSILLLKQHLKNDNLIRIYYSNRSREDLELALDKGGIKVQEWICANKNDPLGHSILRDRINTSLIHALNISSLKPLKINKKVFVSGIGTSEAHAKYFAYMCNLIPDMNAQFIPTSFFNLEITDQVKNDLKLKFKDSTLMVITQGMSPHGILPITKMGGLANIQLMTAVTEKNPNPTKQTIYQQLLQSGVNIINYPIEDEYTTLIRTIGPVCGFYTIFKLFNPNFNSKEMIVNIIESTKQLPDYKFIDDVIKNQRVVMVMPYPLNLFTQNLKYKLVEGGFINSVDIVGELDVAHGTYQNAKYWLHEKNVKTTFILVNMMKNNVKDVLEKDFGVWDIQTKLNLNCCIIELEHLFNLFTLNLITRQNINQKDWSGKDSQKDLYNNKIE